MGAHGDADGRAKAAWRLRVAGLTWDAIADHPDVGLSNGKNVMRLVRDQMGSLPSPDRSEFHALVLDRGDFIYREALRTYMQATRDADRVAALRVMAHANLSLARVTGVLVDRAYNPTQAEVDAQVAYWLAEGYSVVDGRLMPPAHRVIPGEVAS